MQLTTSPLTYCDAPTNHISPHKTFPPRNPTFMASIHGGWLSSSCSSWCSRSSTSSTLSDGIRAREVGLDLLADMVNNFRSNRKLQPLIDGLHSPAPPLLHDDDQAAIEECERLLRFEPCDSNGRMAPVAITPPTGWFTSDFGDASPAAAGINAQRSVVAADSRISSPGACATSMDLPRPDVAACDSSDHAGDMHAQLASVQEELQILRKESARHKHELLQHIELLQAESSIDCKHIELLQAEALSSASSIDCSADSAVSDVGSAAIRQMHLMIQHATTNAAKYEVELNSFTQVGSTEVCNKVLDLSDDISQHQLEQLVEWLVPLVAEWDSHSTRCTALLEDFEGSAYELAKMNAELEIQITDHVSKLSDSEMEHFRLMDACRRDAAVLNKELSTAQQQQRMQQEKIIELESRIKTSSQEKIIELESLIKTSSICEAAVEQAELMRIEADEAAAAAVSAAAESQASEAMLEIELNAARKRIDSLGNQAAALAVQLNLSCQQSSSCTREHQAAQSEWTQRETELLEQAESNKECCADLSVQLMAACDTAATLERECLLLHQTQADAPSALAAALQKVIKAISEELCCPITTELLHEPVVALDGMTYEKSEITRWFEANRRSPVTNEVLQRNSLTPNHLAKCIVEKILQLKADCEADMTNGRSRH